MSDFNLQEFQIPTTTATAIDNNSEDESIDFSLLRLDSSTHNHNHHHNHTPCTTCGCSASPSSNKRRSPDRNPQDQLTKKPKKLFLEPHETTTTNNNVPNSLPGFSNIYQPHCSPEPFLRRCISDTCSPPALSSLVPQSPPESSKKGSASLPPKPPLRRSVSDLSPNKSYSRSSSSNGSSGFKWLKKMRDSMKEINQWWDEIMPNDEMLAEPCNFEEEEAEKVSSEDNNAGATEKSDSMKDCEESVCVEKTGECLIIHFKCPCSKRYQILLSGGNCYYKLM